MSHYFDRAPSTEDERRTISVEVWGERREFVTSTGVFSGDRIDKATALLLAESTAPPAGSTVLDLGCGWGPIACSLAAHGSTVWAVDVNERALELTAQNARGLDVHTALPDDVPADLRFDAIWSNPPIRIGKEALHELLLTWLPRLRPGGEARLVVGRNLGADSLQRWLTDHGHPAERVASSKGFRVLSVR
ncbi:class I SAM-dependent methyltransferase [Aeromicrobium choanae]|uniref:16S rRNA m(2)G 1207 methyltransferase n=1 Tax=Aeromicrobium choanae TaxID=1736691 RepID=A0A1T4YVM9_9ACTN|nr:methyltransferase [Aeromicrobium choanae]SKB05361.1 16S rRNA m(2)G 1207 methyltransferase [Aeromicrobium choanae]